MKTIVWCIMMIVLATVSFYFGAVIGFNKGGSIGTAASAPADAIILSDVLKRIRQGQIDNAIDLLEFARDRKIEDHWMVYREGRCIFDVRNFNNQGVVFNDTALKLMKNVVDYRSQFHPKSDCTSQNDLLNEAISYYESL